MKPSPASVAPLARAELRNCPPVALANSEEAVQALPLHNHLATHLQTRMGFVRGAARFVFRNPTDLIRLATSAYDRRRSSRRTPAHERRRSPSAPAVRGAD